MDIWRMILVLFGLVLGAAFIVGIGLVLLLRSIAHRMAKSDHGYYQDDVVDYEK